MKLSARQVATMLRVKQQLNALQEDPLFVVPDPTVEEYRRMDPLSETTMSGQLAGRAIESFRERFPKTASMMEWIRNDLKKWPWATRA